MKKTIYCCGCEKDVEPHLVTGKEIYPHRKDLYSLPFWRCNDCMNFVGCHHKTTDRIRPLGCIPTPAIKAARKNIHKLLDPLWQLGKIKRKDVYRLLSEKLGKEYHTAEIRTTEEAEEVCRYLKGL